MSKKQYQAAYRAKNRDKILAYQKQRKLQIKMRVLGHYGKQCAKCGFDDYRALQIDHVENNGSAERMALGGKNFSGWRFYDHLIKSGFPSGYQTLCANCNNIKQWKLNNPS